jgi:hypothetical protein
MMATLTEALLLLLLKKLSHVNHSLGVSLSCDALYLKQQLYGSY